ncbi:hypothetical protein EV356DRAFT_529519 [Viridothelium virens]|uniref:Uncharacterized protein n=1 Tax=Viridothelium virens TaxID=1048519 RepID=A0A6A6HIQ5_VIRVR|nr:hypothetical protein EV356DRAFT_529519 [Viridothelium virens]
MASASTSVNRAASHGNRYNNAGTPQQHSTSGPQSPRRSSNGGSSSNSERSKNSSESLQRYLRDEDDPITARLIGKKK